MTFAKGKRPSPAATVQPVLVDDDDGFPIETSGPEETMLVVVNRGVVEVPHPTLKKFLRKEEDGTLTYTPRRLRYFPGSEVTLEGSRAKELIELGTVSLPGELPKVGKHPDLVQPRFAEDPEPPAEPRPLISKLDDGR
jgi:hypothetical protein